MSNPTREEIDTMLADTLRIRDKLHEFGVRTTWEQAAMCSEIIACGPQTVTAFVELLEVTHQAGRAAGWQSATTFTGRHP